MIGRRMFGVVTAWVVWGMVLTTGHADPPTGLTNQRTITRPDGTKHTYALTDPASSWTAARDFVNSLVGKGIGVHLVTIDGPDKNTDVFNFVKGVDNGTHWIDLNCPSQIVYSDCMGDAGRKNWRWASDPNATPPFLNFRGGQPDDSESTDRYAVLNNDASADWDNYPGSAVFSAIVELDNAPPIFRTGVDANGAPLARVYK